MKKRVLSLILCLAVMLPLIPGTVINAGAAMSNVVTIQYYADAALTHKIYKVGKVGGEFYAAVSLNEFTDLYHIMLTIGYDTEYLQLLDADGNPAVIDNENPSVHGKRYVEQKRIVRVPAQYGDMFPRLTEKNGIGMMTMLWAEAMDRAATLTEDTVCAVFKFRAIKAGETGLHIPSINSHSVYDEINNHGIAVNSDVASTVFKMGRIEIGGKISGACGDNIIWTLDSSDTLTLSGSGAMVNATSAFFKPWSGYEKRIKKVVIEDGITTIGNYAFSGCENLESVEIPGSVVTIGNEAFKGCTSLYEIVVPEGVKAIKAYAFANSGLKTVVISEGVSKIAGYGAFYKCENLEKVIIPGSVTSIGSDVFYGCGNLTIYLYAGSYAEAYANENNIKFKVIGDINGDGKLNTRDVTTLRRYLAGGYEDTITVVEAMADVNGDGRENTRDVAALRNLIAG